MAVRDQGSFYLDIYLFGLSISDVSQEYTDGKLKVLVYHNSNPKVKRLKKKDLEAYDVIMISCTPPATL